MGIPVFLSWSGDVSSFVADNFLDKLKQLFANDVKLFKSNKSISPGSVGFDKIRDAMRDANHSLLFITRENRGNEWIPFEAGAISKLPSSSMVTPILIGFPHNELTPPLSLFQTVPITEVDSIINVFKSICKDATGGTRELNDDDLSKLNEWLNKLNDEITKRLSDTVENNINWRHTTICRVSNNTNTSPFQATDALRIAKRRVVFVGQNLYTLATNTVFWNEVKDFLLKKGKYNNGDDVSVSERLVDILFLASDGAPQVKTLVKAWAYTVSENPKGFRDNLSASIIQWKAYKDEAKKGGYDGRFRIRLATTFIPLSQTFIDPGVNDDDGKLFLRPFYRGPESEKRPVILLTKKCNRDAYQSYWDTHSHLWDNENDTCAL